MADKGMRHIPVHTMVTEGEVPETSAEFDQWWTSLTEYAKAMFNAGADLRHLSLSTAAGDGEGNYRWVLIAPLLPDVADKLREALGDPQKC